jgi:hypothetical protein
MGSFWWADLPLRARRLSAALFGPLSDGAYLTGWPAVAACAPPLAFVLGLVLGSRRPESWVVPTSSIAMMAILVTVGGFGAALGLWLSLGYVLGDFALRQHSVAAGHTTYGVYALAHVRAPLVIAYVVIAGLAALVPLGSRQLSASAALGIRPDAPHAETIRRAAHGVLAGLLTGAWLITAPMLLHPVFTWQGLRPPPDIIPPRHIAWIVGLLAAGVALGRHHVESLASSRPGYLQWRVDVGRQLAPEPSSHRVLPVEASLLVGAAVGTFLLSGLLHSAVDAVLLGSVLLLVGVLRRSVSQANSWTQLVSRVPVVVRLAGGVIIGGVLARAIIGALWEQSPVSLPMVCAIGGSLCVTTLLLAGAGLGSASPDRAAGGPERGLIVDRRAPIGIGREAPAGRVSPAPATASLAQGSKHA